MERYKGLYFAADKGAGGESAKGTDQGHVENGTSVEEQDEVDDSMSRGEDESMEDYMERMNETHGK
jgi:hypothetical protein